MKKAVRSWQLVGTLLLVLGVVGYVAAADDTPESKKAQVSDSSEKPVPQTVRFFGEEDMKARDKVIHDLLKEVINSGARLYNVKADQDLRARELNRAGCYRIYQGSLLTLKPLLNHQPELQKMIDDALAAAEAERVVEQQAFGLRDAMAKIRAKLKPQGIDEKKPEEKKIDK